jgi:hypothetical protein
MFYFCRAWRDSMGTDRERLGFSDGERPGREGPVGDEAMTVRGTSFWYATQGNTITELNVLDHVEVDGQRTRWSVRPVTGDAPGEPVESASPRVAGYLRRVVAEKARVARRYRPHKPLTKPEPKRAPRPTGAPVPCPLCRPGAGVDFAGEAWPDCELCDGEGVVTERRAAEWCEEHG